MSLRIPRGYDVRRPYYQELCEGVRPVIQTQPLEAWTGLPPVAIDQLHHDPIVLDAGTIVGIATGAATKDANTAGKVFPAAFCTTGDRDPIYRLTYHSDGADWGLPTTTGDIGPGTVKPIGVVFAPQYSFNLQNKFTNYQRSHNVGVITDYVIQIPARTVHEHAIYDGDMVMVAPTSDSVQHIDYGMTATTTIYSSGFAGRFKKYSARSNATLHTDTTEFIVGRCLRRLHFGSQSSASAGTLLQTELATNPTNFALTTAGAAEFQDLDKVQTYPGQTLAGSGTKGVPGHLLGALADSNGYYVALTILVRL